MTSKFLGTFLLLINLSVLDRDVGYPIICPYIGDSKTKVESSSISTTLTSISLFADLFVFEDQHYILYTNFGEELDKLTSPELTFVNTGTICLAFIEPNLPSHIGYLFRLVEKRTLAPPQSEEKKTSQLEKAVKSYHSRIIKQSPKKNSLYRPSNIYGINNILGEPKTTSVTQKTDTRLSLADLSSRPSFEDPKSMKFEDCPSELNHLAAFGDEIVVENTYSGRKYFKTAGALGHFNTLFNERLVSKGLFKLEDVCLLKGEIFDLEFELSGEQLNYLIKLHDGKDANSRYYTLKELIKEEDSAAIVDMMHKTLSLILEGHRKGFQVMLQSQTSLLYQVNFDENGGKVLDGEVIPIKLYKGFRDFSIPRLSSFLPINISKLSLMINRFFFNMFLNPTKGRDEIHPDLSDGHSEAGDHVQENFHQSDENFKIFTRFFEFLIKVSFTSSLQKDSAIQLAFKYLKLKDFDPKTFKSSLEVIEKNYEEERLKLLQENMKLSGNMETNDWNFFVLVLSTMGAMAVLVITQTIRSSSLNLID